ncbi:MAG: hypothetical protein KGJ90_05165 [Patescibacteria group bacterium]|nr:hypothetical protein [Patescibacteria group bacterium]
MDSEVFEKDIFTERLAWIWLIGEAAWKDCIINIGGKPIALKRGQVSYSIRFLAKKWGWSNDRVQRYIDKLLAWSMISTDTSTGQTIITICNYSKYQDNENYTSTASSTDTSTGSSTKKKKERKKEEEKKDITADAEIIKTEKKKIVFNAPVIKLTESDWNKLKTEFSLDNAQLESLLNERDEFLQRLDPSDNRRSRWWLPTMKWLKGESANLKFCNERKKIDPG